MPHHSPRVEKKLTPKSERKGNNQTTKDPNDEKKSQKKVIAPEFDGRMDPNAFFDWLVTIEEYFDWYEMTNSKRVRFVKRKLTNSAKMYWQNMLQDMLRLGEPPIT